MARKIDTVAVLRCLGASSGQVLAIYAAVTGFHGGLGDICNVLAEHSGIPANELAGYLYVHYGEAAVTCCAGRNSARWP